MNGIRQRKLKKGGNYKVWVICTGLLLLTTLLPRPRSTCEIKSVEVVEGGGGGGAAPEHEHGLWRGVVDRAVRVPLANTA